MGKQRGQGRRRPSTHGVDVGQAVARGRSCRRCRDRRRWEVMKSTVWTRATESSRAVHPASSLVPIPMTTFPSWGTAMPFITSERSPGPIFAAQPGRFTDSVGAKAVQLVDVASFSHTPAVSDPAKPPVMRCVHVQSCTMPCASPRDMEYLFSQYFNKKTAKTRKPAFSPYHARFRGATTHGVDEEGNNIPGRQYFSCELFPLPVAVSRTLHYAPSGTASPFRAPFSFYGKQQHSSCHSDTLNTRSSSSPQ